MPWVAGTTCTKCGGPRDVESRYVRRDGTRAMRAHCRSCENQYHVDRRAQYLQFVRAAKDRPCMDCGVKYHPYVMDFDHVRGEKVLAVAKLSNRGVTLERIAAEIAKCDVVCANCHRMRTLRREEAGSADATGGTGLRGEGMGSLPPEAEV